VTATKFERVHTAHSQLHTVYDIHCQAHYYTAHRYSRPMFIHPHWRISPVVWYRNHRRLSDASTSSLVVRRTRLSTIGDQAFPVADSRLWNTLPLNVTAPSLTILETSEDSPLQSFFLPTYSDSVDRLSVSVTQGRFYVNFTQK